MENETLFQAYRPPDGAFDELLGAPAEIRPHWQRFAGLIDKVGPADLSRRGQKADRMLRENGMVYNAYGDPGDVMRPWDLDILPLLISADEWQRVSAGLIQRATLLNQLLADLYGPQSLLTRGLLPAEVVFNHPGFMRPFHNVRPGDACHLHLIAVDLVRSADGAWWVIGERTDAPLGFGYTLENRIVMSRMLPDVMRKCQVLRLASFFRTFRETLAGLSPARQENPRIVLLSQGPTGPNYFEDAYLARYLGYNQVEGGDLTVRGDRVFLKTLSGLLPVDVIFRRISDLYADPLEIRAQNALGVPGLLQAARSGNVAVANALGSSLVESPALIPFLPALAKEMLGEELLLPSVATWWCGQPDAKKYVLDQLDKLIVKGAYRVGRQEAMSTETLAGLAPAERMAAIESQPEMLIGQEPVSHATAPGWKAGAAQPYRFGLRAFLVATGDTYAVLPGGLVSVSTSDDALNLSILAAERSKDAWVLSDRPVRDESLLRPPGKPIELRRSGAALPSRVADNVFWFGRHVERSEGLARLLRTILMRMTSESELDETPVAVLLRCLAAAGGIEPGFVVDGHRDQLPTVELALPLAVLDRDQPGSLCSTITAAYRNASMVRDRLSHDSWRIIHGLYQRLQESTANPHVDLTDTLELVNEVILDQAALDGLIDESMTRTQAWQFLDLGARLERAMQTISVVRSGLLIGADPEPAVLEAILEVADSLMTYRSRYLANLQSAPVLDLLLTDETNPRALVYQLGALADHVDRLPRDDQQPLLGTEQRIAQSALSSIRMLDAGMLYDRRHGEGASKLDRVLAQIAEQLPRLSRLITHRYLVHADTPRQLAEGRR